MNEERTKERQGKRTKAAATCICLITTKRLTRTNIDMSNMTMIMRGMRIQINRNDERESAKERKTNEEHTSNTRNTKQGMRTNGIMVVIATWNKPTQK